MSTAKHCKIFYLNSLIFPCKYNFWRGNWVLLWWLMTIFGGVSIWCWIVLSVEPIVPSLVVRKQDLRRLGWEKIHQKYTLEVIFPLEVAKTALLQFGRNHQEGVLRYSAKYLSSSKSLVWQKMGSPEKNVLCEEFSEPNIIFLCNVLLQGKTQSALLILLYSKLC